MQLQRRHIPKRPQSLRRNIFLQGSHTHLSVRLQKTRNRIPLRQEPTGPVIDPNRRHNLVDTRLQIAVRHMLQSVADVDGHLRRRLAVDGDERSGFGAV